MSLSGKRVLVTRAKEQASALASALREKGAIAVQVPVIQIVPTENLHLRFAAIKEPREYDWVVFTSANGVRLFFSEGASYGHHADWLKGTRVAAIGPATAKALRDQGAVVESIPSEYRGEAVAQAIIDYHRGDLSGISVLLFRAEGARQILPEMLQQAGGRVEIIEAYLALPSSEQDAAHLRAILEKNQLDAVTFTSSSTVSNTIKMLGDDAFKLLSGLTIASIGPITTDTALKYGLRVDVTASQYTVDGLVKALDDYFTG
jgi:uroporphyrinogen III methyltransferase/synthase